MTSLLQKLFGFRATFVYDSGAKVTMRFAYLHVNWRGDEVTNVEWRTPYFAPSRQPLFINVDHVTAVWQGRV